MRPIQFLLAALLLSALTACASKPKQPASSWRMIDEGDNNPFIHDNPERAGTITKHSDDPR